MCVDGSSGEQVSTLQSRLASLCVLSLEDCVSDVKMTLTDTANQQVKGFGTAAGQQSTGFGTAASQQSTGFGAAASQQSTGFGTSASQQSTGFGTTASQQSMGFGADNSSPAHKKLSLPADNNIPSIQSNNFILHQIPEPNCDVQIGSAAEAANIGPNFSNLENSAFSSLHSVRKSEFITSLSDAGSANEITMNREPRGAHFSETQASHRTQNNISRRNSVEAHSQTTGQSNCYEIIKQEKVCQSNSSLLGTNIKLELADEQNQNDYSHTLKNSFVTSASAGPEPMVTNASSTFKTFGASNEPGPFGSVPYCTNQSLGPLVVNTEQCTLDNSKNFSDLHKYLGPNNQDAGLTPANNTLNAIVLSNTVTHFESADPTNGLQYCQQQQQNNSYMNCYASNTPSQTLLSNSFTTDTRTYLTNGNFSENQAALINSYPCNPAAAGVPATESSQMKLIPSSCSSQQPSVYQSELSVPDIQAQSLQSDLPQQLLSTVQHVPQQLPSTVQHVPQQLLSTVQQVPQQLLSTVQHVPQQLLSTVQHVPQQLLSTVQHDVPQLTSSTSSELQSIQLVHTDMQLASKLQFSPQQELLQPSDVCQRTKTDVSSRLSIADQATNSMGNNLQPALSCQATNSMGNNLQPALSCQGSFPNVQLLSEPTEQPTQLQHQTVLSHLQSNEGTDHLTMEVSSDMEAMASNQPGSSGCRSLMGQRDPLLSQGNTGMNSWTPTNYSLAVDVDPQQKAMNATNIQQSMASATFMFYSEN